MCNDSHLPPAPSRGGAIAALRMSNSATPCILRFSNSSCTESTEVTCESPLDLDISEFFIHKYSDPAGSNPVLRRLSLSGASKCDRLELDVSEKGIIGRGCSVVKNGERIGFGVVGWQ